ncbi:hypothetical protein QW131_02220 [Roseibium salinum]|nr:hypothetical protein [Roseibium salinum]
MVSWAMPRRPFFHGDHQSRRRIGVYRDFFGALGDYRPEHGNHVGALVMVTGVAGGATSWWILVSAAVSHFRARINDRWLDRANHIAGVILIAFGALIYLNLALDTFG